MNWRLHHKAETVSTNLDARDGTHGDVYTADFQTAGRGRLDHRWESKRGENLLMSAVMTVGGIPPEVAATLPLAVGIAVSDAVSGLCGGAKAMIKWPNDVLLDGRKIAGILCERNGDEVIVGIGVNVGAVPEKFAETGCALGSVAGFRGTVATVRDAILRRLGEIYELWVRKGFAALHEDFASRDYLKGRQVEVFQTDTDAVPVAGICGGVSPDGSLDVGGIAVYAGEAHVSAIR